MSAPQPVRRFTARNEDAENTPIRQGNYRDSKDRVYEIICKLSFSVSPDVI